MSIQQLQDSIRSKKTPIALGLKPEIDKIPEKLRKNFEDMYGAGVMAETEALRYHGTQLLEEASEKLPAVMIHTGSYLRYGAMGMDVLGNLVSAAKAKGLYTILGCATSEPMTWFDSPVSPDAVTVNPYLGTDSCHVPEDKAVFSLTKTCNPSANDFENLMVGDRNLYVAMAAKMARMGAGLVVGTGYSLDIKSIRKHCEKAFLLLPNCDAENAVYGFDEYGHGALMVDFRFQYGGSMDEAIRQTKQLITVL